MTDTKQITFEGRSYTVPVWVEWVARDANGDKCYFKDKPKIVEEEKDGKDNGFFDNTSAEFGFLDDEYQTDWRDSLARINQGIEGNNMQEDELLPCPFCGQIPELPSGDGTQYEIECSCGKARSGVQICDLMTIKERNEPFCFLNYRYKEQFVERAKKHAILYWNTRAN